MASLPPAGTASPSSPEGSSVPASSLPQPPASSLPASSAPAASSSSSFSFPHYYNFPPMFTLQPNLVTRRAQLDKWSALILAYCQHYRIFRLFVGGPSEVTSVGPVRVDAGVNNSAAADDDDDISSAAYYAPDLFANRAIDRALAPADVRHVLDDMKQQGRVDYVSDKTKNDGGSGGSGGSGDTPQVLVYWKTPEEWAAAVEAYVDDTAQRGSVLTLYELTSGDGTRGSALHGLDGAVLQRALGVLVKRGKAQVFGQAESLGVKFF